MSTQTTNSLLVKPLENEFYDINIMNANMDKIDEAMKANEDAIASRETPVGAQAKVDAHKAEASPHPQYALNIAVASVQNTLVTHTADNAKHGIYTDTSTNKKYQLGVLNGLLYYNEVI